jgi:hypothetical protein
MALNPCCETITEQWIITSSREGSQRNLTEAKNEQQRYVISPSVGIGSLIVDKPSHPIYSKLRHGNYNSLTFRILRSKTFRPIELIDPEINLIFSIN